MAIMAILAITATMAILAITFRNVGADKLLMAHNPNHDCLLITIDHYCHWALGGDD